MRLLALGAFGPGVLGLHPDVRAGVLMHLLVLGAF